MVMEEGSKIQMTIFDALSKLEQFRNIVAWKVSWMTDIIVVLGILVLCLAVFLPQRIVFWLIVSAILIDGYTEYAKRQVHVKRMLAHLQTELQSELRLTAQARRAMSKMATDPNV
ncbi:hypothetical protein FOZ63_022566, partial [Perkinsus olseni]